MEIRRISVEEFLPIRQELMYPGLPLHFSRVDNDAQAEHYGLYAEGQLITVVSLFQKAEELQFRKLATLPGFQGQGYGQKMIQHLLQFAADRGCTRVCCNARLTATAFYKKLGMSAFGDVWNKNGISYLIMEKKLT